MTFCLTKVINCLGVKETEMKALSFICRPWTKFQATHSILLPDSDLKML